MGLTTSHVRWLRIMAGTVLLVVPLVVAAPRWEMLLANHPAYPVALLVATVVGVVLVATGARASDPPREGAIRTTLRVAALVAALGAAAVLFWFAPFGAAPEALVALRSDASVQVTDTRSSTVYEPSGDSTAASDGAAATLVLYPGARVDPRAYAVLARGIAEQSHRVVVLKCPFDTAFFCAAPSPDLTGGDRFVVAGHSLGGVAASTYASGSDRVSGLVLWASYPPADLSGSDLAVTSIYGTNDGLSTPADIDARRDLLPASTLYVPVEGAIHAFFGDYGTQPGDGRPATTRDDAQAQIVNATVRALDAAVNG
jgi:hypothetical protein